MTLSFHCLMKLEKGDGKRIQTHCSLVTVFSYRLMTTIVFPFHHKLYVLSKTHVIRGDHLFLFYLQLHSLITSRLLSLVLRTHLFSNSSLLLVILI